MGRGSWDQYYRDSISDSTDVIVSLNQSILKLIESKKAIKKEMSIFDYFKPFYKEKQKDIKKIDIEIKELEDRIKDLKKSIKSDQLEMYD